MAFALDQLYVLSNLSSPIYVVSSLSTGAPTLTPNNAPGMTSASLSFSATYTGLIGPLSAGAIGTAKYAVGDMVRIQGHGAELQPYLIIRTIYNDGVHNFYECEVADTARLGIRVAIREDRLVDVASGTTL